jgi:hypothetical protein
MITHFEMTTGELLHFDGETTGLAWDHTPAIQPRLQTIAEARSTEPDSPPLMPADLLGVPVERILARFV